MMNTDGMEGDGQIRK